jgi:hypothetical protein
MGTELARRNLRQKPAKELQIMAGENSYIANRPYWTSNPSAEDYTDAAEAKEKQTAAIATLREKAESNPNFGIQHHTRPKQSDRKRQRNWWE